MTRTCFTPTPTDPGSVPARPGRAVLPILSALLALLGIPGCDVQGDESAGRVGGVIDRWEAGPGEAGDDEGRETGRDAGREAAGVPLETPIPKPDFVLTDVSDGEPFQFRQETEGFVTLVFVGYTHCPDVCPVHMANLAAVLPELPRDVSERIRVVFISSDPERDTPERIRAWLSSFDPSFVGLRGTREEVHTVEDALGLPRSVVEEGGEPEDTFVGHAAQVLAFETDDTARVGFPWGTRQRDWRRALPGLVPDISSGES